MFQYSEATTSDLQETLKTYIFHILISRISHQNVLNQKMIQYKICFEITMFVFESLRTFSEWSVRYSEECW